MKMLDQCKDKVIKTQYEPREDLKTNEVGRKKFFANNGLNPGVLRFARNWQNFVTTGIMDITR